MLKKIINCLIALFLFLLPFQTRWIYAPGELNGGFWEYGTLSFYGTELLLWLIILLFVIDFLRNRKNWPSLTSEQISRRAVLFVWGLGALLFAGFLIWHSLNSDVSYQFVLRLVGLACLIVILRVYSLIAKPSLLTTSLWLGGVLQGALSIFQFFTQSVFENKWLGQALQTGKTLGASVVEFGDERWLRAYGSFGSPNSLGIYLAVILILGMIVYLKTERSLAKIFLTAGQLIILSGLILSFSRAAWLAAAIGIIFVFKHNLRDLGLRQDYARQEEKRGDLLRQLFFYVLIFLLFFISLRPLFTARVMAEGRLETKSISERRAQVADFQNIFSKNIIFGVGPGAYTAALYKNNPRLSAWDYQPVHNIYLLALAEFGSLGFILLAGLVGWAVKNIAKNNYRYLSLVLCLFIAGLFDHWLFSMWTGLALAFVIFGLALKKD